MSPVESTLPEPEITVLTALGQLGAATPVEVEVKTGRIGEDIQSVLNHLLDRNLVEFQTTKGGYEDRIYFLSAVGRKILGLRA